MHECHSLTRLLDEHLMYTRDKNQKNLGWGKFCRPDPVQTEKKNRKKKTNRKRFLFFFFSVFFFFLPGCFCRSRGRVTTRAGPLWS